MHKHGEKGEGATATGLGSRFGRDLTKLVYTPGCYVGDEIDDTATMLTVRTPLEFVYSVGLRVPATARIETSY